MENPKIGTLIEVEKTATLLVSHATEHLVVLLRAYRRPTFSEFKALSRAVTHASIGVAEALIEAQATEGHLEDVGRELGAYVLRQVLGPPPAAS